MSDFHYEWSLSTDPERVRQIINELGSQELRIRWTSGGGAAIKRDVSDVRLERWKVRCFHVDDLEEIESFLREALAPLASHEIKMHPIYRIVGPSLIGWVFWKWKEQ